VTERAPFGRCVALGLGGVLAEALADVSLRPWPVAERDVREMLDELHGRRLLEGFRGRGPVDRAALVATVLALAGERGLVAELGARVAELECNPLVASGRGAIAADARLALYEELRPSPPPRARADFSRLFEPRSVAVVGASASRASGFGNLFLRHYREYGFRGALYAVHPGADAIGGVPAVASLAAAPEPIDYALVAVPAERAPEVLRGARGCVRFAQVVSGGFGETGESGRRLEAELLAAAHEAGLRLLGPNCMGVWCARGRQTFLGRAPERSGGVSVISQSGGLAGDILQLGDHLGIGFACLVSLGNAVDVGAGELLRWLLDDPHTRAIGLYLEDPRDGAALVSALREARGRKPVALLVGGTSRQGGRAAATHTGALAADAALWRGIAAGTGCALCSDLEGFLGALRCLEHFAAREVAPGPEVLVIGPGGGSNVLATDACDRAGLAVTPLDGALARDLRERFRLGPGSSLANPVEVPVGPLGDPALAPALVRAVLGRVPFPDVLLHVNAQSFFSYAEDGEAPLAALFDAVARLAGELPGARITVALRNAACAPPGACERARAAAARGGALCVETLDAAAAAIAAAKRFGAARARARAESGERATLEGRG
jgi:acyl-CoA synthetase (NDP forming)